MSLEETVFAADACRAIVRQAAEWVITRLTVLPEGAFPLIDWPEAPELIALENAMNAACLSRDKEKTKDAAHAYCAAYLAAIKLRRELRNTQRSTSC